MSGTSKVARMLAGGVCIALAMSAMTSGSAGAVGGAPSNDAEPSTAAQSRRPITEASVSDEEFPDSIAFGIGGAGSFAYLVHYVALGQGFLQEELDELGVEATSVDLQGSVGSVQAVQAGDAQYATSMTSTLVSAIAEGSQQNLFFSFMDVAPLMVLARPEVMTEDPRDLVGLKWGIPSFGTPSHVVALKLLDSWGKSVDDVTFVAVGNVQAAVASIEAEEADVYFIGLPVAQQFIADGSLDLVLNLYDPAAVQETFGGPYLEPGLIAQSGYLDEHPILTASVVRAHERAIEFIHENAEDNPGAIVASLPEAMQIPTVLDILSLVLPGVSADGAIDPEAVDGVIAAMLEGGVLEPGTEVSSEDVIFSNSE